MTTLTNWLNGVVTYTYDSRGNLIATTNANDSTTAYSYDIADRLVALTNAAPDATVIAAYALTLDAVGNHTQATHNQPLFPILPNQTNNYTHDSDNRLATIAGQIVTHNANGDFTGIGTNIYTYDFEDRLVQCSLANTSNTFIYDGLGNRLACTVNGQARHFGLDRMGALTQVLTETDTNNSPVAYYVYGLGLAQRISFGGTVATYHFNIQGSVVALTDSGGKITDSYAFDSFGVLANADGDSPQPFRYLGRYGIIDDSTGLLYARARYFSPQLGRFLTKDPVTGMDSDSQSLNRYVYALNNPLRFKDPTGFVATEGRFWWAGSSTAPLIIVPEQAEVLLSPRTANSTPPIVIAAPPNWDQIGQGLFNVSQGLLKSIWGTTEALPGLTISGIGLAACGETIGVTCATVVPLGLAVAAPGLLQASGGISTFTLGASQIGFGLFGTTSPLENSKLEKYADLMDQIP
jgi:RHS repeat-associated protein